MKAIAKHIIAALVIIAVGLVPSLSEYDTPVLGQVIGTNGMAYAQVNKSGCVVHDGNCQIRLDFYLEPEDVRYYDRYLYLVDENSAEYLAGYPGEVDELGNPVDQADYDKWWESLPRTWVNTPFHTHFVYLPATFTEEDIKAQIDIHLGNFYQAFQDYWDEVPGGMRHGWATETRIPPTDYSLTDTAAEYDARVAACEDAIDTLTEFFYKPEGEISGETFPATEIDVGPGATDMVSVWNGDGFTIIDLHNPANDTGTIDTLELYVATSTINSVKMGTFSGSAPSFTSRDYESLGNLAVGFRSLTGKDCDVSSGDFIGIYWASGGGVEHAPSGYTDVYYKSGDQFGAGAQSYTQYSSGCAIAIYGTGETAGCSPSIELNQSSWSINSGSPVDEDSTYNTGLDWCTITNNSGGAVTIYIQGTDMTGGGYNWDLSDDASNGDMIYGMHAGLYGGSYNIVVKESTTNTLKAGLADEGTQDFGLQIYTPTNFDDGNNKSGTITLTAVCD